MTEVPSHADLTGVVDRDGDGDLDFTAASGPFAGFLDSAPGGRFETARWRLVAPGESIASLALVEHSYGPVEILVETIDQRQDRGGLGLQNLTRKRAVGRADGSCHEERVTWGLTPVLTRGPDSDQRVRH